MKNKEAEFRENNGAGIVAMLAPFHASNEVRERALSYLTVWRACRGGEYAPKFFKAGMQKTHHNIAKRSEWCGAATMALQLAGMMENFIKKEG